MNQLNAEFFDEFKSLDNICKDMYRKKGSDKLGVTLYLDDMDKNQYAYTRIPEWSSDYKKLKRVRNIRNDLAHSNNTFGSDLCTEDDIHFIQSFKRKILSGTDPLALLAKQKAAYKNIASNTQAIDFKEDDYVYTPSKRQAPVGCLGAVIFTLIAVIISAGLFL